MKDTYRREGKGRRCCFGDGIDSIPCRTSHLAPGCLKKRTNGITATWWNGCLGKTDDHPVHSTSKHHHPKMDVLPKSISSNHPCRQMAIVRHSSTSSNDFCLRFCLILIIYDRYTLYLDPDNSQIIHCRHQPWTTAGPADGLDIRNMARHFFSSDSRRGSASAGRKRRGSGPMQAGSLPDTGRFPGSRSPDVAWPPRTRFPETS